VNTHWNNSIDKIIGKMALDLIVDAGKKLDAEKVPEYDRWVQDPETGEMIKGPSKPKGWAVTHKD